MGVLEGEGHQTLGASGVGACWEVASIQAWTQVVVEACLLGAGACHPWAEGVVLQLLWAGEEEEPWAERLRMNLGPREGEERRRTTDGAWSPGREGSGWPVDAQRLSHAVLLSTPS